MELDLADNIATDNHGVQAPVITTSHSTLDDGDEAGPAVVKKGAKRAATGPAAAGGVAGVPPRRAGVTPGPQAHTSVSIAAPRRRRPGERPRVGAFSRILVLRMSWVLLLRRRVRLHAHQVGCLLPVELVRERLSLRLLSTKVVVQHQW